MNIFKPHFITLIILIFIFTAMIVVRSLPIPNLESSDTMYNAIDVDNNNGNFISILTKYNIIVQLDKIFKLKTDDLTTGNYENIKEFFDNGSTYGKWAFEHELRRINYVYGWIKERSIKMEQIKSSYRIIAVEKSGSSIWVYLVETTQAEYKYIGGKAVNNFGLGTRHAIEMVNKNDKWLIRKDWYIDPLDEDTIQNTAEAASIYPLFANKFDIHVSGARDTVNGATPYNNVYDREQAVEYADKYNGGAFKTDKSYRYNQKYLDYTGLGGDCTNFVSQCLSDKEGGGLSQDYTWFYDGKNGSKPWVQAQAFKDYLVYSGKGSIVAKGKYDDVVNYVKNLEFGDLICYEEKGKIEHFSIITGFDDQLVPYVNSHSSDRYHAPWDLGWNKNTTFYLIHINN